jgi:hypothetical protein
MVKFLTGVAIVAGALFAFVGAATAAAPQKAAKVRAPHNIAWDGLRPHNIAWDGVRPHNIAWDGLRLRNIVWDGVTRAA